MQFENKIKARSVDDSWPSSDKQVSMGKAYE